MSKEIKYNTGFHDTRKKSDVMDEHIKGQEEQGVYSFSRFQKTKHQANVCATMDTADLNVWH